MISEGILEKISTMG